MCHISVTASSGQHRLPSSEVRSFVRLFEAKTERGHHTLETLAASTASSQPLHLTSEDHTELEISEITSQILSSQLEVGC